MKGRRIGECLWTGIAAGSIRLPHFDQCIGHGLADAVDHPADDPDALARRIVACDAAISDLWKMIAILLRGESKREERTDRLRGGLGQEIGNHVSNGVSSRPRSTMSKTKPSANSGSVASISKRETRRSRACAGMLM